MDPRVEDGDRVGARRGQAEVALVRGDDGTESPGLGDPRREDVDVVDWVEMIPFAETRTYVMRVAESVVIYRAKLKGAVGPVDLTGELKG